MIDEKWPNFKKAFSNFSVAAVAKFNEEDIKRLLKDTGIVRNQAKIVATIGNAKQILSVKREYGSFQAYLDGLDKSSNYVAVIKELGKRFSRLGLSSARIFLYSIGEDVRRPMER